ncbi:ferrochelatase [Thioalkalivibrio denitrificans]|uniref:Ferrochelatase n=1 Tax=Thioalkalivibrio denitrificans TaxID=108003 RepID=A0A1V3NG99_9GAMM|nr:ferrochelatase [Thioalkalivibrio denitrificans]OOG24139.1 ferrochelatase [Thioalkalivibrio denitrificans]
MRYDGESDYRHGSPECLGVLVVNLGTPEAPTAGALRRYLKQFLWDPRVVEIPRPLWWLILNGIVLNLRPKRSARLYEKVWTDDGSPLLAISRRQAAGLAERLGKRLAGPVRVELAMRYGEPSIESGLKRMRTAGARRILVLPLYPQYSGSTAGSAFDAVSRVLQGWRWVPHLRFLGDYHADPGYLDALARSVNTYWETHGRGDRLLMSFHGVPKRYLLAGDPYHCQCQATGRLLAERLGLADGEWMVTFQSRFGKAEWLKPYTDETVSTLARDGLKRLDVVCPGFSADCLETLEEIAGENREIFEEAGGQEFHYIPALNDNPDHLDALADLAMRHLQGWPEAQPDYDAGAREAEAQASRNRALAMGARD